MPSGSRKPGRRRSLGSCKEDLGNSEERGVLGAKNGTLFMGMTAIDRAIVTQYANTDHLDQYFYKITKSARLVAQAYKPSIPNAELGSI